MNLKRIITTLFPPLPQRTYNGIVGDPRTIALLNTIPTMSTADHEALNARRFSYGGDA